MSSTTPTPVTPTAPVWRPMTGAECLRYPWAEAIDDGEPPHVARLRVRFGAVVVDSVAILDGARGLTVDAGRDLFALAGDRLAHETADRLAAEMSEGALAALGLRRAEVLS